MVAKSGKLYYPRHRQYLRDNLLGRPWRPRYYRSPGDIIGGVPGSRQAAGLKRSAPLGRGVTQLQSRTKKRKRMTRRYHRGIYAGRFKRPRKAKKFNVRGVVTRTETVGEAVAGAADGCLWLGGTANAPVTWGRNLLLAVLRYLSAKLGCQFESEHDYIEKSVNALLGNTGKFVYQYHRSGLPAVIERSFNISAAGTWGELADAWYGDLQTAFPNDVNLYTMYRCWIDFATRDVTNNLDVGGSSFVNMKELLVDFKMTSVFKFQNRTGGDSATDDSTTVVEANPVVGKSYFIKGNDLMLQFVNDASITPSFRPHGSTGFVNIPSTDASYSGGVANLMKRPTSPNAWNACYKSGIVRLQPGHIKQSTLSDSGTMYFNTLFHILYQTIAANVGQVQERKFGKTQLFCFQKTMRTGTGTAAVTIGYEHVQYHSFAVRRRPNRPYMMEQN